jgi:hypothetical protein
MAADKLLTEDEAARYISERARIPLSRRTLESWRYKGKVTYVRIGGSVRYDPADLDAFIEAGRRPAAEAPQEYAR